MAKLYFRYGAMNSGKSTALIQVAHNYAERGMRVQIIKPEIDTKGADYVVSRIGVNRQIDHLICKDDDIRQIVDLTIDCLLVDEVQFLTPEQIDQLFRIAVEDNVPVIAYGLRTDFLMNGFPGSTRLLLIAHSVEELKTVCRCGRKAILNARKVDDEFIFEGEQVVIDGVVDYEALCGRCYFLQKRAKAATSR